MRRSSNSTLLKEAFVSFSGDTSWPLPGQYQPTGRIDASACTDEDDDKQTTCTIDTCMYTHMRIHGILVRVYILRVYTYMYPWLAAEEGKTRRPR